MAGARIDVFKGIRPRVSARLLPQGEGQVAENVRLGSGALEPWNGMRSTGVEVSANISTLHRMRSGGVPIWLTWDEDVDVARGPVPDDALERTYYTGLDEPRMTYLGIVEGSDPPDDYRVLGIPAPDTAPTVTGDEIPDNVVTGTVTAFGTPNLKADFTIDQGLPNDVNSWYMALTENGAPSDNGYESQGTSRTFRFSFPIGKRLRVASVVDENTVTVEDADNSGYVSAGEDDTRSGQTWWRTEDTNTTRAGYFRFYIPDGVQLTITGHSLEEGDVIRVTSVPAAVGITFTAPANVTEGGGHFFGWESDNGAGDEDTNTWPDAPTTVGADDFYKAGATAYPFVDIWVDDAGAGSSNSFDIDGQFEWQLIERDGVSYSDIATDIESRVYVYTFVSELGEEGPPSPASDVVTIPTDGSVTVGTFEAPPSDQRNITHMRIYRANTGSESTEFQFVDEIESPFSDYTDSVSDVDLGEVLQTESWEPPPEDLEGLVALPNGVLAGFFGKTLCFSEPNFPHAWPPEYRKPVDHDIVGLGVLPNGVAVLTVGPAYIAAGDHPRAMSLRHFTDSQSCVSKHSIVSTIDSVIYASPDGLVSIGAGGFRLLTEGYARKKEWQAFHPETIRAFWHDGKYFGFHSEGGLVFAPADDSVGLTTLDVRINAGYLDAEDDVLYLVPQNFESLIVAVASDGPDGADNITMHSEDGIDWTSAAGPEDETDWQEIAYSEELGLFVAVRGNVGLPAKADNVMTSPDGINWTLRSFSGGFAALDVIWAAELGLFIACGVAGEQNDSHVQTSPDGVNWTKRLTQGGASPASSLAWSPELQRVVVLESGAYWISNDGEEWEFASDQGRNASLGLVWAPELRLFAAISQEGDIWTSLDGITWTQRVDSSDGGDDVAWSPSLGMFIAVGQLGAVGHVMKSTDGITWESVDVGATPPWRTVEWVELQGLFILFAETAVYTSPDGETWTQQTPAAESDWQAAVAARVPQQEFIYEWDGDPGNPLTESWKSGRIVAPYPLNLAAGRVVADAYPVTFRLYNERGTLVTERSVLSDKVFRLPGGYTTSWFEIEIEGDSTVHAVHVAETVQELFQG